MKTENLNLLTEILSIPTFFGEESLIQEYLINYGTNKGYIVNKDEKGNIYFEKGIISDNDFFPCVCAHMDSVFSEHVYLIENNKRKLIQNIDGDLIALLPDTNTRTGLAGDDLAGVFICLQMMENFNNIKAAFFVEEEFGCQGSKNCDESFFNNVGYVIQFDAPGNNWYSKTLSGVKLFDDNFNDLVKPVLEKYDVTNYTDDTYTDVLYLKDKFDFCCVNIPSGYHNWHTMNEYVNIDDVQHGIELGVDFITKLGNNKYTLNN